MLISLTIPIIIFALLALSQPLSNSDWYAKSVSLNLNCSSPSLTLMLPGWSLAEQNSGLQFTVAGMINEFLDIDLVTWPTMPAGTRNPDL